MSLSGMPRADSGSMDERGARRARIATVIGESLREVAILMLVFAPLDVVTQGIPLTPRVWLAIIVAVALMFILGVYLETR